MNKEIYRQNYIHQEDSLKKNELKLKPILPSISFQEMDSLLKKANLIEQQ